MKKIISLILAICMLASLACISASASGEIASGELEGFTWSVSADGTLSIQGSGLMPNGFCGLLWQDYDEFITSVVVGEGILNINNEFLFYGDYPITTVQLPSTLLSIGDLAFQGCSSLQTINLPDSLRSIGGQAFDSCSSLKSIVIPEGVTSLSDRNFIDCTSLTSVKLSSKTTYIGTHVFSGCTSLRYIELPDSISALGDPYGTAFTGCKALVTVTIPGNAGTVFYQDFYKCTSLKTAIISEGVTTLGEFSFADCSSLKAVYIPSTISNIEALSFAGCTALTDVYYGGSQGQWSMVTISDNQNECLTNATIHYNSVPAQASLGAQYSDVNYNDWYCATVSWAAASGTASGTSAATFNPKGTLSVAEMIQMMYNGAGAPAVKTTGTQWYAKAQAWGISMGYITASDSMTAPCSRLKVAQMMYSAAGSPGASGTSPFSDASDTCVIWAYQNSITVGDGNGHFNPSSSLTRAEAVQFIRNVANAD